MLEKISATVFSAEYKYGCALKKKFTSSGFVNGVCQRICALGISAFAALATAWDLLYMSWHTLGALLYSITHLKDPRNYCSTTRTAVLVVVEFFRHLAGACAGTLVGIFSPKKAAQWFLPSDQSIVKNILSKEQAEKLYEMMGVVHQLFGENAIDYSITEGTLLGATRHQGIIPSDDDIDILVPLSKKEQILAMKDQLAAVGIGVAEHPVGIKIFDLNGDPLSEKADGTDYKFNFPFIDVILSEPDKDGHITYLRHNHRINSPKAYLTEDEWQKRALHKFGPFEFYGPPEPRKVCKRMYGANVFQYGYQLVNHKKTGHQMPRKYLLKKEKDGFCLPIPADYGKALDRSKEALEKIQTVR